MSVMYMHLHKWEDYKRLENQMKAFNETTHTTTGGFYHKSIRLAITDDVIIEFHGPLVGGYGHHSAQPKCDKCNDTGEWYSAAADARFDCDCKG